LAIAKANIKYMIYELCHVVFASIRRLAAQAEMEVSHKDPVLFPILDFKSGPRTLRQTMSTSEHSGVVKDIQCVMFSARM
jgi:hypothetical protein